MIKYIASSFLSILIVGMFACSNDDGASLVKQKVKTDYTDFNIYYGAKTGATKKTVDTVKIITHKSPSSEIPKKDTIYLNVDSLYATYVSTHYFSSKASEVRGSNSISFEFLDNDLLSFAAMGTDGYKVIAPYMYKEDSLFVLKNGVEPIFVARKEENGQSYFRTVSLLRIMLNDIAEPIDDVSLIEDELLSLGRATELAGFANSEQMTNQNDSIIWCNVKFIYR